MFDTTSDGDTSYFLRLRRLVDAFCGRFLDEVMTRLRFFVVCLPSGAGVAARTFSMSNDLELCVCMRRRQAQL